MSMYKYTKSSETVAKAEATLMFEEVSTGVYHVVKDRYDGFNSYATQHMVVGALNSHDKVAVIGNRGLFTNFQLKRGTRNV